MLSEWLLFSLLLTDVPQLKKVLISDLHNMREQIKEELNESPVESLVKLLLFRGERFLETHIIFRPSLDSPMCQTRAAKWDLSSMRMELGYFWKSGYFGIARTLGKHCSFDGNI